MTITTIGLDLAKSVFQVHGVDAKGAVAARKTLRRSQVLSFFFQNSRHAWLASRHAGPRITGRARLRGLATMSD